jgi:hypothetical protein
MGFAGVWESAGWYDVLSDVSTVCCTLAMVNTQHTLHQAVRHNTDKS